MPNRNPLDALLDVVVYAPLGAVLTVSEELPNLAEKGRELCAQRLGMARVVGQFAVQQGRREAERRFQSSWANANGADVGPTDDSPAPEAADEPSGTSRRRDPGPPPRHEPDPDPAVQLLAIPGYDSLSAPQVVQRLAGLSAEEREAVRSYEATHRGRQTILARVAQLHDQH